MKKKIGRFGLAAALALGLAVVAPPLVANALVANNCVAAGASCTVTAPGPASTTSVMFKANSSSTSTTTYTAVVTRNGVQVCSTTYRPVDPAKTFYCSIAGGATYISLTVYGPIGTNQGSIQY